MSKFTKGPWERGGTDVRDKDGQLICDASICCPRFDTATVVANARLIAAAPEMYGALEEIQRMGTRPGNCLAIASAVLARINGDA